MSALSPTTPTRPSNRQLIDGHTGSAKRVSPRTSLHSPYSARFTRSLSGRQHNADSIDPLDADDPHQNLSRLSIHTPPSAERNSSPRYQRRSSSQSRERPSIGAVHTTYADETRIITRNMEMMSLEERMLWEYLNTHEQGADGSAHSYSFGGTIPSTPIHSAPALPYTPTTPQMSPHSPAYSIGGQISSVESSPAVMTPPPPSYALLSYSPIATPSCVGQALHPLSPPPLVPRPAGIYDTQSDLTRTIARDPPNIYTSHTATEPGYKKELAALLEETPSRPPKQTARKEKRDKQFKSTVHHRDRSPEKLKAKHVSAKHLRARKTAKAVPGPTEYDTHSSDFVQGSSAYSPSPSSLGSTPDQRRVSADSQHRRRIVRDKAEFSRRSIDSANYKRRLTIKPYSKGDRIKGKTDEEGTVLPVAGDPKGRNQRMKQRVPLLQTKPLPQTPLSPDSPTTFNLFLAGGKPASLDDGYEGEDEAQDPSRSIAHINPLCDKFMAPQIEGAVREEEEAAEVEEVERFLLS